MKEIGKFSITFLKEIRLKLGTYYLLSKLIFGKFFRTRIPSRKRWTANPVFRECVISMYKLNTETDIGSEMFFDDMDFVISLKLSNIA